MKQSSTYKSEFFVVFIKDNNGTVTRDSFNTRTSAQLFHNDALYKRDDIEQIDILELLSSTTIKKQSKINYEI